MRQLHPFRLALLQSGQHQYQVAQAAGLSETTLSRIASGRREASPDERQRLARVLGRGERELFPRVHR